MNDTTPASRSVVMERELPHPPEKVWRALTVEPLVGHKFSFRTAPMPHWNGIVECEVLAVEPNRRLSYRWNAESGGAAGRLETIVTWTLTPTKGGVLVRMEQEGFRAEQELNFKGAVYGWQKYFDGLARVAGGLAG